MFVISICFWCLVSCSICCTTARSENSPKVELKYSFTASQARHSAISTRNTNGFTNQYRYNPKTLLDVYNCYNRAKLDQNEINVCDAISRLPPQYPTRDIEDTYNINPINNRRPTDYSYPDYDAYKQKYITSAEYKTRRSIRRKYLTEMDITSTTDININPSKRYDDSTELVPSPLKKSTSLLLGTLQATTKVTSKTDPVTISTTKLPTTQATTPSTIKTTSSEPTTSTEPTTTKRLQIPIVPQVTVVGLIKQYAKLAHIGGGLCFSIGLVWAGGAGGAISADMQLSPILLTIVPDTTEVIATEGEIPDINCQITGTNLPKLIPFVVSWYQRENAGMDVEVNFEYNTMSLPFNKTLTGHDLNHEIYCSIKFNIMAPTVFAKISSQYVKITRINKANSRIFGDFDSNNLNDWIIIGGAVGAATLLLIIIVLIVVLIRYRTRRADTNNRPPEPPPTPNHSSGVYETPDDPIYSYVPISVVTFYEAKAMAAANKKFEMQSIPPPPLPQRPPNLVRSDDYDYAYAVNGRRPSP